jgi:hypothetical protein
VLEFASIAVSAPAFGHIEMAVSVLWCHSEQRQVQSILFRAFPEPSVLGGFELAESHKSYAPEQRLQDMGWAVRGGRVGASKASNATAYRQSAPVATGHD